MKKVIQELKQFSEGDLQKILERGFKILWVEDDKLQREILLETMPKHSEKKPGYIVRMAENTEEFKKRMKVGNYDLFMVDMHLGEGLAEKIAGEKIREGGKVRYPELEENIKRLRTGEDIEGEIKHLAYLVDGIGCGVRDIPDGALLIQHIREEYRLQRRTPIMICTSSLAESASKYVGIEGAESFLSKDHLGIMAENGRFKAHIIHTYHQLGQSLNFQRLAENMKS